MIKLLKDSAVVLTVVTAFLYIIGTAHFYGIFISLSIDPFLVERNFHQILYSGTIVLVNNFGAYVIGLIISYCVYCICDFFFMRNDNKKTEFNEDQKKEMVLAKLSPGNKIVFSIFVVLLTTITVVCTFQYIGKKKGYEFLEKVTVNDKSLNTFYANINDSTRELYRIGCGLNRCVGMEKDTFKVRYISSDSIEYMPAKKN